MMKPPRLNKGDLIGIVAPAGPVDSDRLQRAIPFFEKMGMHVKLGKHVENTYGYLAGMDAERLADFHDMVADDSVKAIIFARGGYGTGRIAGDIDYELIRNNPKIIWGYSDITYLHTAIRQETGLATFHGPMPVSDIADDDFDTYTAGLFQQLLEPSELYYTESVSMLNVIAAGEASAEIVGGNLSLLISTLGTPYEIDTAGKLLLLEDIGEAPYRIDAMLNQLKLAGKFAGAAGVIIGDFAECDPPKDKPSLTLEEIFQTYLGGLNGPVVSGFNIGHCMPNFSLPLGVPATLSSAKRSLIIEPGIR
ncbi:S66 peptidase family protein [Virgibacillus siamensis]|uniref:S66 peptidase family protein n=1 Tax=Virgibacillus siamensis TaxID=480071 RepID=UPI00158AF19A|nr:LD-carboxypeptidase [Virgibacillus siamensis]